jgi:hypothetical protein
MSLQEMQGLEACAADQLADNTARSAVEDDGAKSACACDELLTKRLRPSPQTEQERHLEESQDFYPKIRISTQR